MLNNTLSANEVKDSAGTGIAFSRLLTQGRETAYAKVGESPSLPYRMQIRHQETGSGIKQRRRSVVRFDKTVISPVDNVTPVTVSAYIVLDAPTGALTTSAEMAHVIANINSFTATTGAGTTVLFNGTGLGSVALLEGSL